jgi:hypothetical protein
LANDLINPDIFQLDDGGDSVPDPEALTPIFRPVLTKVQSSFRSQESALLPVELASTPRTAPRAGLDFDATIAGDYNVRVCHQATSLRLWRSSHSRRDSCRAAITQSRQEDPHLPPVPQYFQQSELNRKLNALSEHEWKRFAVIGMPSRLR